MTNAIAGLELEVDKPGRMTILHPKTNLPLVDKDGEEAFVEIYSTDSPVARQFGRAAKTARLRTRNPNSMTGEKLEDEEIDLFAALTTGWRLIALDGTPVDLPFTRTAAAEIYGNNKMAWLFDQVKEFAASRANFSGASSTT